MLSRYFHRFRSLMHSGCPLSPKKAKIEAGQFSTWSRMTIGETSASSAECDCPFIQQPGSIIRKSLNDTRQYRIVTLSNSLKVLLISDLKPGEVAAVLQDEESEDEEEENDESGSERSEGESGSEVEDGDPSDVEEEIEEPGDFSNHTKHRDSEKLSAAALCIGVGSFSDPPDIPGLAHFLEHMVFMGSEKYPDENAFDAFIKKHGGNDNAYTDCERTVFYFDIQRKHFRHALDIFAQFFTSPLMKQGAVDREIKAVDSEFDMNLNSDSARKEQLLGSLAQPGHPMGKFMWGNSKSLKTDTAAQGIDIYSRLQDFYRKHYSAHVMTLAVQSKDSLDNLEEWVTEIFSKVPNNNLPKDNFDHLKDPFETHNFNKLYKVIPVKNLDHLEITWALPPLGKHYRAKPLNYISWLLGHEEKGSIISYLKKKLWALSITSGNGDGGFEFNSTHSSFSISITLTEEGFIHVAEVLTVVFDYLAMLRRVGPCYRGFKEIQTIENNDFRWQEQSEPVDYVEKICENMQLYPPEEYLTGDSLLFEYEPQLIEQCQNLMTPDRANIMVFSKKFEEMGICNQKEKWFQTDHCVEDVPEEWMQAWMSPDLGNNPELHLPKENEFIATDFSLKEPDMTPVMEFPVAILDNEQSKIWYMKDMHFNVPKAYIFFHLISPIVGQTPQSMVLMDLMVQLLQLKLAEEIYSADLAQLSCAAKVLESGLELQFSGFNHKLHALFHKVVNAIADFNPSEDLFSTVKEQTKKMYYNTCIKPNHVVREIRLAILQDRFWPSTDKHFVVDSLTYDMLMSFVQQFRTQVFIEGMVHGNMTVQEALDLEVYMCKQLKCTAVPKSSLPKTRVHQLPAKTSYCRVKTFNTSDCNSVVTNYYQCGPENLRLAALNELVIMRMEEPCFDILRTREQLGYSVFCTHRDTNGVLGMSVTVCTQANKFKTQYVDEHIEMFLNEFDEMLQKMSEEEFESLVNAMITTKKCEDSHMGEVADRNWGQIVHQQYIFDRRQKTIAELEKLTLQEFRKWHYQNTLESERKKLSVQVIGDCQEHRSISGGGVCSTEVKSPNTMEQTGNSSGLYTSELKDVRNMKGSSRESVALNPEMSRRVAERCSEARNGNKLRYQMVCSEQCEDGVVEVADITDFKESLPLFPICKLLL
ncbi:nardilysin [Lingula anatina]|uniref:Nardilysin n=1 Tax=Lingula anatina TaxID=7574 RepID=A0A1S3I9C9_LINAN|nr:nardilysin [Lingula anatina]|eukprot:XP_013394471.1 nardilysin [Lingula anatina]